MKSLLLCSLVILVSGCAASTQSSASNPNQVVCKRETTTGSHTSRRVCRTVAQIEAERAEARQALEQRRSVNSGGGQ